MLENYSLFRFVSRAVSYVAHPIFVICYGLILLRMINPYLFATQNPRDMMVIVIYVFAISVVFPGITMMMLFFLGMNDSLEMPERKERIIPLIITGTFYLWLFINMLNNQIVPIAFSSFLLGATIALFLAFFINLFSKISLHAIGIAGLATGYAIIFYHVGYQYVRLHIPFFKDYVIDGNIVFFALIAIMGLVGSSRIYLKMHTAQDVWGGYLVGIISQIIAARFLLY